MPVSREHDPVGETSFGPSFLVAGIPLLIIPAGFIVEQARRATRGLVYATYAVGAMVNGIAAFVVDIPPVTCFDVSPFTS